MTSPTITFVIPVRNDAARLERCLRSILAATVHTPFEIIVADNGSTDASAAVARAVGATVVELPDRAVSEVRNKAAELAKGDLLAFVDSDNELGPGWAEAALHVLADPSVWAVGANYHAPPDGTWVQLMYDRFRSHVPGPQPTDWLPSGNLVVRRSAFAEINGFDTTLESCEDVDLCQRLRRAGGTLVESARLTSVHHGDPKTLRALFFAELWRGRDNLRVSLRERLTLRSMPSVVIPILHLLAVALTIAGAVRLAFGGGLQWVATGIVISVFLTTVRAFRLLAWTPAGAGRLEQAPKAWAVAAAYDAARALALVGRASHDVRRKE